MPASGSSLVILAGVVLTLGACTDSPTQPDRQRVADVTPAVAVHEAQVQGCVLEGFCFLDPISGGWCEPWMHLDWTCDDGDSECTTSAGDPRDLEWATAVQGCPDGGTPLPGGGDPGTAPPDSTACGADCPPEGEEEDSDICPEPLGGRTLTYLVNIAGRNHEFQFTGTMHRVNPLSGRSPAWYRISGPTASKDTWWIPESGNIQLVCWGRWHFRTVWLGTIVVQDDDLHMVMGPGHPDF